MTKFAKITAGRPSKTKARDDEAVKFAKKGQLARVNFEISAKEHVKLKVYAAQRGRTIREILSEYVAKLKI